MQFCLTPYLTETPFRAFDTEYTQILWKYVISDHILVDLTSNSSVLRGPFNT